MRVPIRTVSVVVASIFASAVVAADPPKKDSAEAVRKSLDETISVEIADQPFPAAIVQLGDLARTNIVFDRTALLATGDGTEMPITLHAKFMKLRTALKSVTAQAGLSFGVVGDQILISTEETICQRQLHQHVSVDWDDVPFTKALKDLAKDTATNLVLDPRQVKKAAEAKVTMKVDDVPLETVLRLMSEMAGLKPARMGNVLFVTSEERAEKLKDGEHPAGSVMPTMIGGGINIGVPGPAIVPGGAAVPVPPAPPPAKPKE